MQLRLTEIQRNKTRAHQKCEHVFFGVKYVHIQNECLMKLEFICLQPIYASKLTHKMVYSHVDSYASNDSIYKQIKINTSMMVSAVAIIIYIVLSTLREFVQIYQQKWQYLFEPNNFISWMLYISAGIMVSPVFNGGWLSDTHFSATSITVFLSWFNLLLFLQRFDQVCCISIFRFVFGPADWWYFKWIFSVTSIGWHLCGHVFGDFTNIDQSAFGIFDFNYCVWFGVLHCSVKIKGNLV